MPVRNITPDQFAEKWNRRLKAAVPDIRQGIERLNENPCEKAANAQEKMKARLIEAIDSGKWAARLRSVTLDEWKKAVLQKGLPAISAGADLAVPKVQDFATQLLQYERQAIAEIDRMPTLTLEDSIRKMEAWIRKMAQFRYKPGR